MIKWIIIIIVALVALGYFGIDVRKLIDAPATQSNLHYAEDKADYIWNNYLKGATLTAWDQIFRYVVEPGKNYVEEKFGEDSFTTMKLNTSSSTEKK